jgi:SAM-dependent methyltransferase
MAMTQSDGSAGDANYGAIGQRYSQYRQPEPAIAAALNAALGDARTILNVGAGAGSYEPLGRLVTPVEPSASMRAQRPRHLAAAVDAVAESLPFPDQRFDAALATFTVHQWSNLEAGLAEIRRVTQGPVVILTCDPLLVERFWLNLYAPAVLQTDAKRYPRIDRILATLGGSGTVSPVMIPLLCRDGFNEAYYGRPEMLLDPGARQSCSAWSFVSESMAEHYVQTLAEDLRNGRWDEAYGHLRHQPEFDRSLRLIVSRPRPGLLVPQFRRTGIDR